MFADNLSRCPNDRTALLELPDHADPQDFHSTELPRFQAVAAVDNRYTIVSKIGQGGWGGVYRAYQHSTKREVALKVLRSDVADDTEVRRRFHREAEAVCKLNHPNTVIVYDFGETADGLLFLAMEYLEGESLDAVLEREGVLSTARMIRLGRQIARSLAEAHDKGIVHRDVKPHNIMIVPGEGAEEFIKVLDFGVAKLVSVETSLTTTGATFGTPEYMSPEQVQSKEIDHRSDLYALGVIFYEMLAGRPPFSGNSAVTVAMHHVRKHPPPLRPPQPLPRPLARLIKQLLAKDPSHRPQTAGEVAQRLEEMEKGEGLAGDRPRRTTQMIQQVIGKVADGWPAALTVLAAVCAVIVAVVLVRGAYHTSPGAQDVTVATGTAESLPSDRTDSHGTGDTGPGSLIPGDVRQRDSGALSTELPKKQDVVTDDNMPERHREELPGPSADVTIALPETTGREASGDYDAQMQEEQQSWKDVSSVPQASEVRDLVVTEIILQETGGPEAVPAPEGRKDDKERHENRTTKSELAVRISATVSGATVWRGGRRLCRLPCTVSGRPGTQQLLTARREGYRPDDFKVHFRSDNDSYEVRLKPLSLSEKDGLKGTETLSGEDGLK